MSYSAREKVERARFQLYSLNAFLAMIFYKFKIKVLSLENARAMGLKAAGIDIMGKTIYFNESFVEALTVDQLVFVFAHEAMHYILYASARESISKNYPDLYNIAQDIVINDYLYSVRLGDFTPNEPIGYINEETFEWSPYPKEGFEPFNPLYEEKYFNWTTEEVFRDLLKRLEKKQEERQERGMTGPGESGGQGSNREAGRGQGEEEGEEGQPVYRKGSGGYGKSGKRVAIPIPRRCPVPGGTSGKGVPGTGQGAGTYTDSSGVEREAIDWVTGEPESEKDRRVIKDDIGESVSSAMGQGYNPYQDSFLGRIIDEALRPKLNWRALLQRFVYRTAKYDFSWSVPSKSYYSTGVYLPSVRSQTAVFVVAIDCSGSVDDETVSQFVSEVYGLITQFPFFELWILAFTTKVEAWQVIKYPGQKVDKSIFEFFGGTNYRDIFEFIEERMYIRPDALIILTDLECGPECFPDFTPHYPVLWVCSESPIPYVPPFGEIVEMID